MVIEIICISFLGIIIIGLLVERFLYAKEMMRQLENANKAVMSRNINDYLLATKEDKPNPDRPSELEDVMLDEADETEFDSHIKQVNS